jgi:drug/metabolite transporter (DMT)-like permease
VLIAFIALAIGMLVLRRPFKFTEKRNIIRVALVGIVVALHWITFYQSIQLSTASLGILCLSTTTVHVAWLEPLVMKRKFLWSELALSVAVIGGIYFVSSDFSANDLKALAYGLSSALFAATFAVFNAKFAKEEKPSTISLYEMGTAFLFLSVVVAFQGRFTPELLNMGVSDFLWLLFLGVLCTSFAFLATIEVVKHLGAFSVSLSINLEPVYTILLAVAILDEHKLLNKNFYIGAAIIVVIVGLNGLIKAPWFVRMIKRKSSAKEIIKKQ